MLNHEYTSKNSLLLLSFHFNYNHSKQRYDMQFAQNTVLARLPHQLMSRYLSGIWPSACPTFNNVCLL